MNEPKYISHIRKNADGSIAFQSNEEHCQNVAELAKQFAAEFGMGDFGYVMGLLHDKGKEKKYRIQLQSSRQHVKNKHDFRQIREICEATHWSDDFKSGSDIVYCGKYCREIRNKIEFVKGYNENGSDKNNEKENNIYANALDHVLVESLIVKFNGLDASRMNKLNYFLTDSLASYDNSRNFYSARRTSGT